MKVFAIVVSFNGGGDVIKCLKALKTAGIKTVVVDNASTDGSVEEIKKFNSLEKIIVNRCNLGFAKGNNQGIKFALLQGADLILLVNQDVFVNKNTLPSLIKAFDWDKNLGLVAPVINHPGQRFCWYDFGGQINPLTKQARHINSRFFKKTDSLIDREFVSACCVLISRQVFKTIGFFDQSFFLYFEDVDFCHRAIAGGFTVKVSQSSSVFHKTSSSLGENSPSVIYYNFRNHLFFVKKHFPFYQLIISLLFNLLRIGKFLIKERENLQPALRATVDFICRRTGKIRQ